MNMEDERPEKKLKLDARNDEHKEIVWLKERVKDLEERRSQMKAEQAKFEEENSKFEKEKNKVEQEKSNVQEEKNKIQEEKNKIKEEKNKIQEEKNKIQVEKTQIQDEIDKVQEEKNKVQEERRKAREEINDMEAERVKFEEEKNQVEVQKKTVEEGKRKLDEAQRKAEGKLAEKLRQLVECPVCLSMPRKGPVPCCAQGHIVCCPCLNRCMEEGRLGCPTCREPMGEGKSLLALAVIEEIQHECNNQGCTEMFPLTRIEQHENECDWRLIICPGKDSVCNAMVPFCNVESHVQDCKGCKWPLWRSAYGHFGVVPLIETISRTYLGIHVNRTTFTTRYEGKLFFHRTFKGIDGCFTVDIVMKGSKEECDEFWIEATVLDTKSNDFKPAFKATFHPRPLGRENKPGFCLKVSQESLSEVWKYNEEKDVYHIKYCVQIVKLNQD